MTRPQTARAEAATTQGAPLEYSTKQRARRRAHLAMVLVAGLVVALWCARHWLQAGGAKGLMLMRQRQCLDLTIPPDQPVHEEDANSVAALRADQRYRVLSGVLYSDGQEQPFACRVVPELIKFLPQAGDWEPVFVGARRAKSGPERLLIVTLVTSDDSGDVSEPALRFICSVWQPATWSLPARDLHDQVLTVLRGQKVADWLPVEQQIPWITRARVCGGQRDTRDPAHLTIALELNGQPATIDCWLLDNDDVKLSLRGGRQISGHFWSPSTKQSRTGNSVGPSTRAEEP